jgi:phage terminase large subunit-like protein
LRNAWNVSTHNGKLTQSLSELTLAELESLKTDWRFWARADQLPPDPLDDANPWRVWLILGGRGAGKTRAGAEWVRAKALGLHAPDQPVSRRIALVGETLNEVRRVMIEGCSGLLAIHADHERPRFESTKQQLVWPNGAIAQMFSAEDADSLRGPQFDTAWCDEIAKWRDGERVWDMLQFGLRLGPAPQVAVTTTPRPVALLEKLLEDPSSVITRASTHDNAAHLAPSFISEMTRRYAGTILGRQELMGEIIADQTGSLWRRDWIDAARVKAAPELTRIVVAVDPPVTSTAASDACGMVVAGLGIDGRGYILADRTLQGREPHVWARAAIALYQDYQADRIVAEVNQGGDLVVGVLRQIDESVPVRKVHATRGKWLRAEPVAALYAEGRIAHVGTFDGLEDQMCSFGADGLAGGRSPDRLDALVWAITDLMLSSKAKPGIRQL